MKSTSSAGYFRNFVFGVEDSLVSTVGLLSGIAVANVSRETVLLTGIVLILVEAVSMAAGTLLSEYSADSYATRTEKLSSSDIISAVVMFFSYLVAGLIPLLPYAFLPLSSALQVSVVLSIVGLFLLGVIGARIAHIHVFKNALRMVLIGGVAIAVGAIAGTVISNA